MHAYQTLECPTSGWLFIEENKKKSGNVMQHVPVQSMDFCVCGINTSSESFLIRSYLLFARILREM